MWKIDGVAAGWSAEKEVAVQISAAHQQGTAVLACVALYAKNLSSMNSKVAVAICETMVRVVN